VRIHKELCKQSLLVVEILQTLCFIFVHFLAVSGDETFRGSVLGEMNHRSIPAYSDMEFAF
jgi:hypothetical protein